MLSLFFAALALASTVQLQPGVEYAAGTRIAAAEVGLSFVVPARWKGGLPREGRPCCSAATPRRASCW